jgi:hypothetical protein
MDDVGEHKEEEKTIAPLTVTDLGEAEAVTIP